MARIRIQKLTNWSDCDDCGCSAADGALVYLDDRLLVDLTPVARCFDSTEYDDDDIFRAVARGIGVNLVYSSERGYFERLVRDRGHDIQVLEAVR